MQFRVSVIGYVDDATRIERDAVLTVDVTATVGEVARALVRGGAGRRDLLEPAVRRRGLLTLLVTASDGSALVLDAGDPVGSSGLRSGSRVEPMLETEPSHAARSRAPVAVLTVLAGPQEHLEFLIPRGETAIGRDRSNRIELHDPGVSRRHAVLRATDRCIELEDLGSANGSVRIAADGSRDAEPDAEPDGVIPIRGSTVVELGAIPVRIDPGPPGGGEPGPREGSIPHLPAPFVDPVHAPDPVALPAPPEEPEAARFPVLGMLAPLIMGLALLLATRSALSLALVALSPLIMIGTWLDARFARRRAHRRRLAEFEAGIARAERELSERHRVERTARSAETPAAAELAALAESRGLRLWSRRPEHRAFLELRLGAASLPSRTAIELPARGSIPAEQWDRLEEIRHRFGSVPDAPLLDRLDRAGSVGVAGDEFRAGEAARALLVQLLAQHSPADLVLTAFATGAQARGAWAWLAWLPHVDPATSPLSAAHLAADPRSGARLLAELEGVIARRSEAAGAATIRSRIAGSAAEARERLAPAGGRPAGPAIVVLVLDDAATGPSAVADRARLVGLAEDGADRGVHLLWVASRLAALPAACRTAVEAGDDGWRAHLVREGRIVPLSAPETIGLPVAERFGRALAPVVDAGARVLDESDLPRSVPLAQLVPGDLLGSGDAILRAWRRTDSIASEWPPGREREAGSLLAVVGQGGAGPVEIDLRLHGPHALIGGTTGSGKSDFLTTWICSLAAAYSPDRLAILFVDYKGGSAFGVCLELPHAVGLVTDLDTRLVRRALTSLRAELRRREELLAAKGAKDLLALERRGDPDAPPVLLIVVDEFAALVAEIPEFVDGMIDIAQRGRSLGLHLVLATQRPQGVIRDNLRANTNLRICLRMAEATDSVDVLGSPDAAHFPPETQGRAALRVGAGQLVHFQTGYLGGRSDDDRREAVEIRDLGFGEQRPWPLLPERTREGGTAGGRRGPTDLRLLIRNVREAARSAGISPPRKPWLDQLPSVLPLASPLLAAGAATGVSPETVADRELELVIGLVDEPAAQRRAPCRLDLRGAGNAVFFGGPGSGKTSALLTTAVAALRRDPATILYGIDAGGGRLAALSALPGTGDVVGHDERDRIVRLLALIAGIVRSRAAEPRDPRPRRPAPPVLLLLDGFAAFRDATEHLGGGASPFADLVEIANGGRTVGVHVVLASERAVALPAALAAAVPARFVLRLPSAHDCQALGVPAEPLAAAPAGRALRVGSEDEIQLALPGDGPEPEDTDAALAALAAEPAIALVERPARVPAVPEIVPRSSIPRSRRGAAFAIDTTRLAPVPAPDSGLLLVTGPAGSGRTSAIRSLLAAIRELEARAGGRELHAVLVAPRRSALRGLPLWTEVADDPEARASALSRLVRGLGGSDPRPASLSLLPLIGAAPGPPSESAGADGAGAAGGIRGAGEAGGAGAADEIRGAGEAGGSGEPGGSRGTRPAGDPKGCRGAPARPTRAAPTAPPAFPAPGRRGVIVVEDIGGFDGTGDEPALAALLKLLRRSEAITTIVEGENATLGAVWELSAPLRGARWALALQPDANDAPTLFTTPFTHARRAEYPPGRGFLVRNGALTGVQVALAEEVWSGEGGGERVSATAA